jgi:transcriptional regulator with XRE-family HTH domain
MNTKSLNQTIDKLNSQDFDLKLESQMVQSRIVSTLLEVIQEKGLTQTDLERSTGLSQPFISSLLNINKKLSMEHIALFQKALGIVLQPPLPLSEDMHHRKFYESEDYSDLDIARFESLRSKNLEYHIKEYTDFESRARNRFSKDSKLAV